MIKLALASLTLLAGSVRAQVAPSAGAQAWVGPISGAAAAAGTDRISGLGTISLTRLATADAGGSIPMIKSPEILNPMAAALAEAGQSPETFAALPTAEKLQVLAVAAKSAEAAVAKNAAALAAETASGVKTAHAKELSKVAEETRVLSAYLDARGEEQLATAEKVISTWQAAREEAFRAFLEDLPAKMAAGAFDGKTLLVRDDSAGSAVWRTADGSPDETFATPQDALASRVASVETMPAGPWSVAEASLLADAVKSAVDGGLIKDASWTGEMSGRLSSVKERGAAAAAAGKLGKASANYAKNGRMNDAHIDAIEKFYESGLERRFSDPANSVRLRARALATIRTGGSGLPGWDDLQAAKREFASRMNRTALWAAGTWIALLIPTAMASSSGAIKALGGWGTAAYFILMMSPMFVFAWAIWKRDTQSSWSGSYLSELVNRRF